MNLIIKPIKQKKGCTKTRAVDPQYCKPGIFDPDQWVKDLLIQEKLHKALMATTDPRLYNQLQRQIRP